MDILKVMKIYASIMAMYGAFRVGLIIKFYRENVIFYFLLPLIALLIYYFCRNMWESRGLYSLSFMFSLIITDLCFFPLLVSKVISTDSIIYLIWLFFGIAFIAFAFLILYGFINEKNVKETNIDIESEKIDKGYTFVALSDIHFGTIQDKKELNNKIEIINKNDVDFVLLAGDIVEEHTSNSDMKELFSILGNLKTKYGTFFVHGNHDRQEKLKSSERTYTDDEFDNEMKKVGIICLDDKKLEIENDLLIVGRDDFGVKSRSAIQKLISTKDIKRYIIVVEHRPEDCKSCEKAGADLHFTGHYHGAQNWPNNIMYKIAGIYYSGIYNIGKMKLYVSSGFTGSKYPIRTHGKCEYVMVKLKGIHR